MADTSRSPDTGHTTLAATPARQGRLGKPMFWVLVFGVLLAAIGLLLAWTWKAPALSRADDKLANTRAAASATYDAPNPTAATQQKP